MSSPVAATLDPDAVTPADRPRSHGLDALPVALVCGRLEERVRRYVEGELGWQPVAPDEPGLPARTVLVDAEADRHSGAPHVLLVGAEDAAPAVAAACVRIRPDAVVAWPDGRADLPEVVAGLLDRPVVAGPARATVLTVGGSAGGVGTTTVTVALAAAVAWAGRTALAVVRPPVALDVPVQPAEVLSSRRLWPAASPLPGVADARVVCCSGDALPDPDAPAADVVVVDRGADDDVDVLVVRPDRAGLSQLARSVASVIVVNGHGPVPTEHVRRAAAGRRLIELATSTRVARADLRGRGPASYPGTWLRPLLPIARGPTGGP